MLFTNNGQEIKENKSRLFSYRSRRWIRH